MNKLTNLIVMGLLIILVGCQSPSSSLNTNEPTLYTSVYPIQFITEQIVGETAQVKSIYPPGVDAHTYEPTSKQITSIATGDAFIYLGAGLESFSSVTANALKSHDVVLVELGVHEHLFIQSDELGDHGHDHGDHDPHIWIDPLRMIEMAEIIFENLTNLYPKHQAVYEENFQALKTELETLDHEFTDVLQAKVDKHIVVGHAAYGYWEERYGITQIPISGLTSSSEPSQKALASVIELAQDMDINYVLFEQNVSNRLAKIIQDHLQAEALYIHNLEVLTEIDENNHENYLSLMRKNLDVLDEVTQ